jgi:hypothetical protein
MQPDQLEEMIEAVRRALDGEPLTREQLAVAVAEESRDPELAHKLADNWGSGLKPAAVRGALIFAPSDGQKVRFTRPDAWLGDDGAAPDPGDAAVEAARRYLAVHGPATREDVARWWGVQPAPAGRLLKALGDEVAEVDVEGAPMLMLAADANEAAGSAPARGVRLLPGFDQYVIAATRHAEKLMVGDDSGLKPLVYRSQGWISAVLLVDGRMAGVWRYERKGRRLDVAIEPFPGVKLTKALRSAAEEEAESLAAFMGGELALTLSP